MSRQFNTNTLRFETFAQLQLNAPLYTGGATSAQVEGAQGQLRAAQFSLDEARLVAKEKAALAWQDWYASTPDTPCIAICSTSQGDEVCKGCGRSFDEVQRWTEMTPAEKRASWRRITIEGDAWRFNRYAERALEDLKTSDA